MRISKVLNNNVAVVFDSNGQEKIVMGKGICYMKRSGEEIAEAVVDKTFSLSAPEANNKFQVLIQDVPIEHIAIGEEIISEAKARLERRLNDMVYISLIDHIHTSIVRFLDGVTVKNVLLWDIRRFYKDEFQMGLRALDMIFERFKIRLPEDEAGFIALHLANAQMDEETMHNMYEITRIMQEIVNIVRYHFHMDFDEEDVYYYRFVAHLRFFARRLTDHKTYEADDNDDLWRMIQGKYQDAGRCVAKIKQFIVQKYDYALSKDEELYLTIHIERVVNKAKR